MQKQPSPTLYILPFIFVFLVNFFGTSSIANANDLDHNYLQIQSSKGNKEAQNLLGMQYFSGNGVKEDKLKAAELFNKAARQGLASAQFNLAYMYHKGLGLPQDYTMACVWYKNAADQGHNGAKEAFESLKQYMGYEKLKEIARLSSQIPSNSINKKKSPAHIEKWINSIHPAAGK